MTRMHSDTSHIDARMMDDPLESTQTPPFKSRTHILDKKADAEPRAITSWLAEHHEHRQQNSVGESEYADMPQKPYKITYGTTAAPHGGIHHRYTHTSDGQYAQGEVYETVAAYVAETSLSETQSPYKLDLKGLDHDDDSRRQSDTENPETQHAHTQNSHGQTYAAEQDSEYSDDLSYQLDEVHNNISKLRAHLSRKPSDSDTTRADVWPPPNTEFESRAFGRTSSKLQFNKPDSINSTSRATRTNTYTHTQGHTQTDVTKTFDRSVTAPISSHPQAQTRSTTRHTRNTNPNVPTHSHEPARPRFSQPGKERGLDDVLAKLNRKKDAEIADCKREIEALQKRMSEREALFKDQMKEAMGLDQYKTAMKYRNDLDDLRGKHDGEVAELRAKQLHQNRVQMENDATIQELTQDLDQLRYNHDRTVYELEKAIEQATTSLDAQRHISVERQGENEKLAAENKTLTQDRNLLRTQLQESESVKDGLKTRLETLEKAHADCNDTIAALKTASETLTTERDGLQERVELLLFESNADRKQKDLLTSLFAQERESLVQTTAAEVRAQTEREMNEIIGARESDIEALRSELLDLEEELASSNETRDNLSYHLKKYEARGQKQIHQQQTERTTHQEELDELEREKDRFKAQYQALHKEHSSAADRIQVLETQLESERTQRRGVDIALERMTTDLDTAEAERVELREKLKSSQAEYERACGQIKSMREDNQRIRDKVDQLFRTDAAAKQASEKQDQYEGLLAQVEDMKRAHAKELQDNQATYTEVMEALREDLLNTANQDHTRFKKKILKERSKMVKLTEGYRKQCQQYLESISRNTDTRKRVTLPQSPPLPQDTIHHKTKHGNRNKNTNELNISAHADRPMNIEFVKSA